MPDAPSAPLLRTLAAVPPGARIVDAACGTGRHLDPLARLGFDVWASTDEAGLEAARSALAATLGDGEAARRVTPAAPDALGYPDAWADWVVLAGAPDLEAALTEAARVLKPGAWVWVEADADEGLDAAAHAAGLVEAQAPAEDAGRWHAIYRKAGGVG